MFESLKKDKMEKFHTTKLIHKKTENMGMGNNSYKGYYFIMELNGELVSVEINSSNVFNHYQIGEMVEVIEIEKFDNTKQLISRIYDVKKPLEDRKKRIRDAYKNKYNVFLRGCDSSVDMEEVEFKSEWLNAHYSIYKRNDLNIALLNVYDLYGCENFKDYDFKNIKIESLKFNGYLSGFDVDIDDDRRRIILTIKNKDMIYFTNIN